LVVNQKVRFRERSPRAWGKSTLRGATSRLAGNLTVSGGGEIVWFSDWSTALGQTTNAITDGGKWNGEIAHNGYDPLLLTVVDPAFAVPGGGNTLRVTQLGDPYYHALNKDVIDEWSDSYFMRVYFRNNDISNPWDHPYEAAYDHDPHTIYLSKTENASGDWNARLYPRGNIDGTPSWPVWWFGIVKTSAPTQTYDQYKPFDRDTWYRYELHLEITQLGSPTYYRLWPRWYSVNNPGVDDDGTLLFDYRDYGQEDYNDAYWRGANDWTLEKYYDEGWVFHTNTSPQVGYHEFERITLGNNGQSGSQDHDPLTYWYFAQFAVSTTDWCGPC